MSLGVLKVLYVRIFFLKLINVCEVEEDRFLCFVHSWIVPQNEAAFSIELDIVKHVPDQGRVRINFDVDELILISRFLDQSLSFYHFNNLLSWWPQDHHHHHHPLTIRESNLSDTLIQTLYRIESTSLGNYSSVDEFLQSLMILNFLNRKSLVHSEVDLSWTDYHSWLALPQHAYMIFLLLEIHSKLHH